MHVIQWRGCCVWAVARPSSPALWRWARSKLCCPPRCGQIIIIIMLYFITQVDIGYNFQRNKIYKKELEMLQDCKRDGSHFWYGIISFSNTRKNVAFNSDGRMKLIFWWLFISLLQAMQEEIPKNVTEISCKKKNSFVVGSKSNSYI